MKSKLYYDLLGILEEQKALLGIKDELISKLVKDNTEKENLIYELMRGRDPSLFYVKIKKGGRI